MQAYTYWMSAGVRTDKEMPYCSGIGYGEPGDCLPCMADGYSKTLCGNHNDLFCNKSTTVRRFSAHEHGCQENDGEVEARG